MACGDVVPLRGGGRGLKVVFHHGSTVFEISPLRTRHEANLAADVLTLKAALGAGMDRSTLRLRSRKGRVGVHLGAAAANELYRARFEKLAGELQAAAQAAAGIIRACNPSWSALRESHFEAECLLFHGALLSGSVAATAVLLDLAPSLAATGSAGSRPSAAALQGGYQVSADSQEQLEQLVGRPPLHGSIRAATGETALHWAAAARSVTAVQRLLAAAPELALTPSKAGRLPLHAAAVLDDAPVLRLLLQAAPQAAAVADVVAGCTPLVAAIEAGSWDAARLVLEAHPGSVVASQIGVLPLLHWCAEHGRADIATQLLAAAPCAAAITAADGSTALHRAADCRDAGMLQMLLAAWPAAASITTGSGLLPLHQAVQDPALAAAVGCLLAAAPATALMAHHGSLPLHLAAGVRGMSAVVGQLVRVKPAAAMAVEQEGGKVALHHAVSSGDAATVRVLLAAAPAAVNVSNSLRRTPIALCVLGKRTDLLRLLLKAPLATDTLHAALRLVISNSYVEALECLLEVQPSAARILVDATRRETFLHYAAGFGCAAVLQALAQADPGAAELHDWFGRVPFCHARTDAAMRALIPFTPPQEVLRRLDPARAYAELRRPPLANLVGECIAAHLPLSPETWGVVPLGCPTLGRMLPRALGHSVQQARSLVAHMTPADRSRLRLFALCLYCAQRRLSIYIPSELVWKLLSLFDA